MKILRREILVVLLVSLFFITFSLTTMANKVFAESIYTYNDDFSSYEMGSDGSPNWATDDISWEINNRSFTNNLLNKSFALLNSPIGLNMYVESEVAVVNTIDKYWKWAGTSVFVDNKNCWKLILAEKPNDMNNGHYVEFSEMYQGIGLANDTGNTMLKTGISIGENFEWEYNHPYRLSITLNDVSVTGAIYELDGTLKWEREYFINTTNCVNKGIPALTTYACNAKFDNIKISIDKTVNKVMNEPSKQYPKFDVKTNPNVSGKKTGFFHTEKINNTWWVIAPDGKAFFAVGTGFIIYDGFYSSALGYNPYGENNKKIYGTEEKWAENTASRLKEWGFNLLGVGSSPSLRYRGLAHTLGVGFSKKFCSYGGDTVISFTNNIQSSFPNVFSPKFKPFCDKWAEEIIDNNQNDPWLFGYYLDNELAWWGNSRDTSFGLVDLVIEKDRTHTAKIALMNWLKTKYCTIDNLNKAWGTAYSSFGELEDLKSFTGDNQSAIDSDKIDFEKIIIDKYFSITTEAIRKYDKNHMILGCRYSGGYDKCHDLVWTIDGKYNDICTVNFYGGVDFKTEKAYFTEGKWILMNELFKEFNEKAQKPIMISEWSFPAYDSGLPCTFGAGMRVDTQTSRAKAFEIYQKALFEMPFLVGSEFFMWVDPPASGILPTYPLNTNYGLVNEKDEPYALLVKAAKNINDLVYDVRNMGNMVE